jgi:hypothetical protein
MNIKQAKIIPLELFVAHLGGKEAHSREGQIWFYSPFRPDERTPSFKVNTRLNTWYDFARGAGGSILDLWIDIHQLNRMDGQALRAALEGLQKFSSQHPSGQAAKSYQRPANGQQKAFKKPDETPRYKLLKQPSRIFLDSLKEEVIRRGLFLTDVSKHLKQANIEDTTTGKKYNGFAFANDKQGFEISIPNPSKAMSFKTSIGSKAMTSIKRPEHTKAMVFEGFWDFLTWQRMWGNQISCDYYILNSLSFAGQATEAIKADKEKLKTVVLMLDNDAAGEKAMWKVLEGLDGEIAVVGTGNHYYEGYKDLNDFWVYDPNAAVKSLQIQRNGVWDDTLWQRPSRPKDQQP